MNLSGTLVRDVAGTTYRVEASAGAGSQGEVYACRRERDASPFALKLFPSLGPSDAQWARLRRLVEMDFAGTHPALAAPRTLLAGGPGHFSPWAEGLPLAEAHARPDWSFEEALVAAAVLCRALAAMEERDAAHGDLQPGNLHLKRLGGQLRVRLVDFDNAVLPGLPPPGLVPPRLYQAPEVAAGGEPDLLSDRWSAAVLVHELLLLKRPFARAEADPQGYARAVAAGRWLEDPREGGAPGCGLPSSAVGAELSDLFRHAFGTFPSSRPRIATWAGALRAAAASVWSCERCGTRFVSGQSALCPLGGHAAGVSLALMVGGHLLPLRGEVAAVARPGVDARGAELRAASIRRRGPEYVLEPEPGVEVLKWIEGQGLRPVRRTLLRPQDRLRIAGVEARVVALP